MNPITAALLSLTLAAAFAVVAAITVAPLDAVRTWIIWSDR